MEEYLRRLELPEEAEEQIRHGARPAQRTAREVLRRAPELEASYRAKGWDEDLFSGFLADLRSKLLEHHTVHGLWGTDAEDWYRRFFDLRLFSLGRLIFEPILWDLPDQPHVKRGDPAYKCHIPSTGPCPREAALDSLHRAYRFFGQDGDMVIQCKSWMLYPPHYALFPAGGNLRAFQDLFHVVEAHERGARDLWRIFGGDCGDLDRLPEDTALRRAFASWLRAGNVMGTGFGYLVLRSGKPIFPEKGPDFSGKSTKIGNQY